MRVLVTGATGFVGSRLVPALLDAGHDVVALVRDATRYDAPDGVQVVEGDLLDFETLSPAFEGVEAAYYLVHSMQAGEDFEERDRLAARHFATAASEAGVARVVYLGGLGEERDHLSEHLRSRREVETILDEGEYDLTTLRAAIVVGPGSTGFDMVYQLASRLPVMVTPRWVRTPCQPIAVSDAIAYLAGVLDEPETAGETYEIGGPEVLTYQKMMTRTAAMMDHDVTVVPVPVLSPKLSAYWVDLVTDVPRSVAHPLIEGLKNPVVVQDDRIREAVPLDLTSFDEAVRRALRAYGEDV
ncbi:NAD(P)H-binding protein [Halobacteriaceae archaeon GCM10025711]